MYWDIQLPYLRCSDTLKVPEIVCVSICFKTFISRNLQRIPLCVCVWFYFLFSWKDFLNGGWSRGQPLNSKRGTLAQNFSGPKWCIPLTAALILIVKPERIFPEVEKGDLYECKDLKMELSLAKLVESVIQLLYSGVSLTHTHTEACPS